jgi:dihydroorotate dehydrogenase electron transfer subunit
MADKKTGEFSFQTVKIAKVTEENYRIKTFELDVNIAAKPGQFIMVWVPGVGERPFSLLSSNPLRLTIAKVGPVSEAIHKLGVGDQLTFRGPLGNGFDFRKFDKLLLVGGGYGVVPLYFLAKEAISEKKSVTVIIAARTEKDVVLEKYFSDMGAKVIVSTDDGSKGFKGNAVDAAKHEGLKNFDCVFSCGPEKMVYFLAKSCEEAKVKSQLSLERYMKCGIGICGSCDLGGFCVCRDGPIFDGEKLLKIQDFGAKKRNSEGILQNI